MALFAVSSLVPIGLFLFILVAIIVGYYSKRGSDIAQRPSDGLDGAPGAEGDSRIAGRTSGDQDRLDTHGTQ
jgi:hypothetical protein